MNFPHAEKFLDKMVQTLRESTDRSLPKTNFISYGSKQNPENTMRNTKRNEKWLT